MLGDDLYDPNNPNPIFPVRSFKITLDKGRYAPFDMTFMESIGNFAGYPGISYCDISIHGTRGLDPYDPSQSTVFTYPENDNTFLNHFSTNWVPYAETPIGTLFHVSKLRNSKISFKNITFKEYYMGLTFTTKQIRNNYDQYNYGIVNFENNTMEVENCNFYKIANIRNSFDPTSLPTYYNNFLKSSGAALVSMYPTKVTNCTFTNNSIYFIKRQAPLSDETTCLGSSIYIDTEISNAQIIIENNLFNSNQGRGGIVYVDLKDNSSDSSTKLKLWNNRFGGNYARSPLNLPYSFYPAKGLELIVNKSANLDVKDNIFYIFGMLSPYIESSTALHDNFESFNIYTKAKVNEIFRNNFTHRIPGISFNNCVPNGSMNISHCIFEGQLRERYYTINGQTYVEYYYDPPFEYNGNYNITASYNAYKAFNEFWGFPSDQSNFFNDDQNYYKFVHEVTFLPYWRNTYRSIVIDNGNPDLNNNGIPWYNDPEDQDPDGTRLDIGVVRAIDHGYLFHNFVNNGSTQQYNWVCFPYLHKLNNEPEYYDYATMDLVLNQDRGNGLFVNTPPVLQNIMWKYNTDDATLQYEDGSWGNNRYKTLDSRYGFKVQLTSNTSAKTIETIGFLCGSEGNPEETITISAPSGSTYRETWVGFFKKESTDPFVALSSIINQLTLIQTKNWSISRESLFSPWQIGARNPKINFGEMVVLRYAGTTNVSFNWNASNGGGGTPQTVYSQPSPQYFTYNELENYTSIYVKLDDVTAKNRKSNAELALFVNGVCVGAEVVQSDTVEVSAYLSEMPGEDDEVEFRYWEPGMKSAPIKYNDYCVYNFDQNMYQHRPIDFTQNKRFYTISMNKKDMEIANIPSVTLLEGNYPNPFNPETTIRYSLSEPSQVSIKIFNIKGQLVNELVNEKQSAGFKSVVWKGTDSNGNKAPSGVYFYRFDTNNASSTKKMLLMK